MGHRDGARGTVMGRGPAYVAVVMALYSRWRGAAGGLCGGKHRMCDTVSDTVWCGYRGWNIGGTGRRAGAGGIGGGGRAQVQIFKFRSVLLNPGFSSGKD